MKRARSQSITEIVLGRETHIAPQQVREEYLGSEAVVSAVSPWKKLSGHDGCVNAMCFNEDGSLMLTGSDDSTIRLWTIADQKTTLTLSGHDTNVFAVKFLPLNNNKIVLSGGNDADVRVYNIESETCTVYHHHSKKVFSIATNSRSPFQFITSSSDSTVRRFDTRVPYNLTYSYSYGVNASQNQADPYQLPQEWVLPQGHGGGRTFFPFIDEEADSSLLFAFLEDSSIVRSIRPFVSEVFAVDWHPLDDNKFITACGTGDVKLFDFRMIRRDPSRCVLNLYRHPGPSPQQVTGCAFNYNGTEIVKTPLDDCIYLYDTEERYGRESDQMLFKRRFQGHLNSNTIKGVIFYGPESEFIVSGSDDHRVFIWNKTTGKVVNVLEGHQDIVNCCVTTPFQSMLASSGIDHEVFLWEADFTKPIAEEREKHIRDVIESNEKGLLGDVFRWIGQ